MYGADTSCAFAKFGYNITVVFPLQFDIDSSEPQLDEKRFRSTFSMTLKSDGNCQPSDASCSLPLNITQVEFSRRESGVTTSYAITVRSVITNGAHPFFDSRTPRFMLFDCRLNLPNDVVGVCKTHREYFLLCRRSPMLSKFTVQCTSVSVCAM